ncbi:MAG: pyridoxamine 5'-phosphate oxidase family protein [Oscillospiraceae bacterium]|jgi:nitroimidazol reductase NimA-like FMN-containing flavoprotein (pyridoxamine 5'-phosphate oxidase superfamily)|nr:pyridoxamine 5'-phosphate oxidase family protein [Oscillospiraceae bacterium]
MRRTDREVTELSDILSIIEKSSVCRLALCDGEFPYVVPLNFGYEYSGGELSLYFHCAKEGKKLDLIARNPNAAFCIDNPGRVQGDNGACEFTMSYESVLGSGNVEMLTQNTDKLHALAVIMKQYAPGREFSFPEAAVEAVTCLRLRTAEFSGKRLRS